MTGFDVIFFGKSLIGFRDNRSVARTDASSSIFSVAGRGNFDGCETPHARFTMHFERIKQSTLPKLFFSWSRYLVLRNCFVLFALYTRFIRSRNAKRLLFASGFLVKSAVRKNDVNRYSAPNWPLHGECMPFVFNDYTHNFFQSRVVGHLKRSRSKRRFDGFRYGVFLFYVTYTVM